MHTRSKHITWYKGFVTLYAEVWLQIKRDCHSHRHQKRGADSDSITNLVTEFQTKASGLQQVGIPFQFAVKSIPYHTLYFIYWFIWFQEGAGVTSHISPVRSIKVQLAPAQQVSACVSISFLETCPGWVKYFILLAFRLCISPTCRLEMTDFWMGHIQTTFTRQFPYDLSNN
jgi:hypothetical protein